MQINIKRLKDTITNYRQVALYGCGGVAKETYEILLKLKIEPLFCVVTDRTYTADVFEKKIPVYDISEKEEFLRCENILLILAVNDHNASNIKMKLKLYHITNYILITDLDRENIRYRERLDKATFDEWLSEIAEVHIESLRNYNIDVRHEVLKLRKCVDEDEYDANKIVIVIGVLSPRVVKIVRALQSLHYRIEMYVAPRGVVQEICIKELSDLCVNYTQCKTFEELLYYLITSRGKVIHLFTHRGHSFFDKKLLTVKDLLRPVVYDEYDIVSVFYTNETQEIIDNEKYCLEHADAICNRGFEIEYLVKEHDYNIKVPFIQFQDYCNDIQINNRLIDKEGVALCYVGGLLSAKEYFDFAEAFFVLAERCKQNGCHFHVYTHRWNEDKLQEYIELSETNAYFHIHRPISFEKLSNEISKYDYGVFPIMSKCLEADVWGYNTQEKLVYSTTNKYFDYLDAGLPIITAHSRKQVHFFEEYGVVLDWTVEDYDFEELHYRKKELKEKALKVRKKLQISNQIHNLINLYDSISE